MQNFSHYLVVFWLGDNPRVGDAFVRFLVPSTFRIISFLYTVRCSIFSCILSRLPVHQRMTSSCCYGSCSLWLSQHAEWGTWNKGGKCAIATCLRDVVSRSLSRVLEQESELESQLGLLLDSSMFGHVWQTGEAGLKETCWHGGWDCFLEQNSF